MARGRRPRNGGIAKGSFAALLRAFQGPANPRWARYEDSTRTTWGRELRFAERPDTLGAVSVHEIRPALVQAFLDGMAGRPGKQRAALAALKQVEKWALVRDLLPRPITTGVEPEARSDEGHRPWSDDQVALAEAHARPDIARMITLAANTGQRGSDLVRICWSDIERWDGIDGINVRQVKTGRVIWIPITAELAAALARWDRRPGPIVRRETDAVWHRRGLTAAWAYERDHNKELAALRDAGLVMHGLRATACVRLSRAGATTRQISDMVGMSEAMVARYCRFSLQRENAAAAVVVLDRTRRERQDEKAGKRGS